MSKTIDYANILDTSWSNIDVPKNLPTGSWRLRLKGASQQAPKGKDGNASILFIYEGVEPMDDVDESAIAALGTDYDYATKPIFFRVWLGSANDVHRLRMHIAKHGVDVKDMTVGESLKAIQGSDIIAVVGERHFTAADGEAAIENTLTSFTESN